MDLHEVVVLLVSCLFVNKVQVSINVNTLPFYV